MPQETRNIDTNDIRENIAKNSLERDEHSDSSKSKSSANLKTKFNIFLCRKFEVEAELEELLC